MTRPGAARLVGAIVLLALAVGFGFVLQDNDYWLKVWTLVFILGTVAQSWNLLAGYAGQWSLAQTAFFGMGGYLAGIALIHWNVPLFAGLFLGAALTAIIALVIGIATLRIRGHYFALVTFLLTVALVGLVAELNKYTGGQYGLSIPLGESTDFWQLQFQSDLSYYLLAVAVAAFATAVLYWTSHSRLGLLLRTIRDDEDAAGALGVKTLRLKVTAMVISAALAAMAGGVYLSSYKLMDSETAFGISSGLDPVVAGILGGPGWLFGGLLGEGILQPVIAEANSSFGTTSFGLPQLIYGAVLMVAILVIPRGIAGAVKQFWEWWRGPTRGGRGVLRHAGAPGVHAQVELAEPSHR
jgi:branched-chain amino acid transport system permease protein